MSERRTLINRLVRYEGLTYKEAKVKAALELGPAVNNHLIGFNNFKRFKADVKLFHIKRKEAGDDLSRKATKKIIYCAEYTPSMFGLKCYYPDKEESERTFIRNKNYRQFVFVKAITPREGIDRIKDKLKCDESTLTKFHGFIELNGIKGWHNTGCTYVDFTKWDTSDNTYYGSTPMLFEFDRINKVVKDAYRRDKNRGSKYYGKKHPKKVKRRIPNKSLKTDRKICVIEQSTGVIRRIWLSEKLDSSSVYKSWGFTNKSKWKKDIVDRRKEINKGPAGNENAMIENRIRRMKDEEEKSNKIRYNVVKSQIKNRKMRRNSCKDPIKKRRILNNNRKNIRHVKQNNKAGSSRS